MNLPVRRSWLTAALVLLVGILVTAVAVSEASKPTSAPPPSPRDPSVAATPAPGSKPSSGPTGTPAPGSLDVVPVGRMRTRPAVPFHATADFGTGLRLRVTGLEAVSGVAQGPGQVAGPAVRMTVELTNGSDQPVTLESVVLSVSYGAARTPAMALTGPGGHAFGGTLRPGASATGRYVYAIPESARGRVRMVASYTGDAPAVVVAGSVR